MLQPGFIIGLITLVGGTSLAVYLYFKTKKDTTKKLNEFERKIKTDSRGIEMSN